MKVILHSILLSFFCLFIGPSLSSFKLIFRLDLAGFYHSRANRIGRLWIFKIGPLLDYRLYSQGSHKRGIGEFFFYYFYFIVSFALSFRSHLRCSNSFMMFLNEIKLQEHFSPLKVSCEPLCHL